MKLRASPDVVLGPFFPGLQIEHSDSRTATTCWP